MGFLVAAHFHWMQHLARIEAVGGQGFADHRAVGERACRHHVAPEPARNGAGRHQQDRGRGHTPVAVRFGLHPVGHAMRGKPGRHRLARDMAVEFAQRLVLPVPVADILGKHGVVGEMPLDLDATIIVEQPVGIGEQVAFGDRTGVAGHFIVLSFGPPSSVRLRSVARARPRRDISVPTGMSRTAAASA